MQDYYAQPQDETTIANFLGMVFPKGKEQVPMAQSTKLDEAEFELLVDEGGTAIHTYRRRDKKVSRAGIFGQGSPEHSQTNGQGPKERVLGV